MKNKQPSKLFLALVWIGMLLNINTSCNKDDEVQPWFNEIENEYVEFELEDAPAYVVAKQLDCIMINYSKYIDDYVEWQESQDPFVSKSRTYSMPDTGYIDWLDDIEKCLIAVKASDFEKNNISIHSKVYVTASVTNNDSRNTEGMTTEDAESAIKYGPRPKKAYLRDIRLR